MQLKKVLTQKIKTVAKFTFSFIKKFWEQIENVRHSGSSGIRVIDRKEYK